jgi:xylulokinase
MPLVAGVDSSTQSTKVEILDAESGARVAHAAAPHPPVTPPCSEQPPAAWWAAFESAWASAGDPDVAAIGVGGQQHGMVALDAAGAPLHPAKLWNDTESADDATWLLGRLGDGDAEAGAAAWAEAVGSVPVAAFTVTKLSWLHRTHPDAWARLARVLLPHDWLTHRLTGDHTTDRGDASGTGYWSPGAGAYRWDLLRLVDPDVEWESVVPRVLGPGDVAGEWHGAVVAPGTGDNMAAALGIGLRPGDVAVSVGTSGTVFAVSDRPTTDPTGAVAGFADATGRFLPLVCTSNAAKVLDAVARLLGVDHEELDRLALAVDPGAPGPVLLPYFDGERTPYRPDASGILTGLRSDVSREQLARAAVEGVVCGLLDGLDALLAAIPAGASVGGRIVLTGGASRSQAVRRVLAGLVDRPVVVADTGEAVATGAAVQAAAVLGGVDAATVQDRWGIGGGEPVEPAAVAPDLRDRYGELRDGAA